MSYDLLLAFVTDSPEFVREFVRGFEAGRIWAELRDCQESVAVCAGHDSTMHAANAEMILRLAEATGHSVISEDAGTEWINVEFAA